MKKNLVLKVLFALLFSINIMAQKNARPEAITMTLQIGGNTPSNVGGSLVISGLIDVLAFSEGISTTCTANNTCAKPNQQDLSMTIYQTVNFISLRKALINHTRCNIELSAVSSGGDISKIYLEDAYLSSISDGGSGGEDKLTVNITFSSPKWDHYFDPAGVAPPDHNGYDFEAGVPFSHY